MSQDDYDEIFGNEVSAWSSIIQIPYTQNTNSINTINNANTINGINEVLQQMTIFVDGDLALGNSGYDMAATLSYNEVETSSAALTTSPGPILRFSYDPRALIGQTYFVDSLTGATIKDGRPKIVMGNKTYDVNLLGEYLLYSKYFKCPRNSESFTDAETQQLYASVTTPGLKERLEACERLDCPSQKIPAKFFAEIASTIILQLVSICELEAIENINELQKSMDLLWSNFIQSLSALLLYNPIQAALKALELKASCDEALALSSNNPEEAYIFEPAALDPLRLAAIEMCSLITNAVLKLGTMDAIAKIQPVRVRI